MTPENNDLIGRMMKNNRAARAARTLVQFFDVVCQMTTRISKFKVLTTTSTQNSKSFILYIYFNDTSTSPFAARSVNNKECKEEAITKQSPFPKCLLLSDFFVAVADAAA